MKIDNFFKAIAFGFVAFGFCAHAHNQDSILEAEVAQPLFRAELEFKLHVKSKPEHQFASFFSTKNPEILKMAFQNEANSRDFHIGYLTDIFESGGIFHGFKTGEGDNKKEHFYLKFLNKSEFLESCHRSLFPRMHQIWLNYPWLGENLGYSDRQFLLRKNARLAVGYSNSLAIATLSIDNNRKKAKPYQDRWLVHNFKSNSRYKRHLLLGVFDGHGHRGDEVADEFRKRLPEEMTQVGLFDDSIHPILVLKNAIHNIEQSIEKTIAMPEIDPNSGRVKGSGTTATVVLIQDNQVYYLHVGDSKFIHALEYPGFFGNYYSFVETEDHTLDRYKERDRVGKENIIDPKPGSRSQPRIWMNQRSYLDMSRSLGDFHLKRIISSEPEMGEFEISSSHRFGILGTDGLFKPIQSKDAVDIVSRRIQWGVTPILPELAGSVVEMAKEVDALHVHRSSDDLTILVFSLARI